MRTTRLALTATAALAIAALAAGCSSQAARGDAAGSRPTSPTATALAGPSEGDLGDWIAFPAGPCNPGSSYPPQRGIDRTAFQPCIPNF